ncbi:hypothetical protein MMC25_006565 [Agyrium rufum]|nr:hypothetical protein [Agyrium rufum]
MSTPDSPHNYEVPDDDLINLQPNIDLHSIPVDYSGPINQPQPGLQHPQLNEPYSSYDYFPGILPDDMIEMPQSQRALAKERRKAQNRAAQKAFRSRKEIRIKELEEKIGALEKDYRSLKDAYEDVNTTKAKLTSELEFLQAENQSLKSASQPSSPTDMRQWSNYAGEAESSFVTQQDAGLLLDPDVYRPKVLGRTSGRKS